jgi:hypothetical protein
MHPDLFVRAIVNDLFDDDLDEDFFAELNDALDRPGDSAPSAETSSIVDPTRRPRRLC